MDQVRVIVKILWRERFWVLSSVGTLVAVVCWMLASGDLDTEFKKRKSSIGSKFTTMKTLDNKPVHFNTAVNEGDKNQASLQRDRVLEVWEGLYQRQRDEVLFWPKDQLDPEFITEIERLKFRDPFPARQSDFMRSHYLNYIEKRFDGLLEIVQAKKLEGRGGSRGGYGGELGGAEGGGEYGGGLERSPDEEEDYLVQWLDQGRVQAQLRFEKKPSELQIWVTQEDLWVYETLLNVIAKTNERRGATRPDNTAVRAIIALEVGAPAATSSLVKGQVIMPEVVEEGTSSGYGGGEFGGGEYGGEYGGGEYGGGEYGGGEFGGGEYGGGEFGGGEYGGGEYGGRSAGGLSGGALLASRYLDEEGKPYTGTEESFGTTFRQLPIHMKLMMDQRWIPQVLIECANAALPVEIKQLRINPGRSAGRFGSSQSSGGSRRGLEGMDADPTVGEVDIQGVVYIYNEPDKAKLSVPGLEDDQLAEAAPSLQR